jgi:hypothetical protein
MPKKKRLTPYQILKAKHTELQESHDALQDSYDSAKQLWKSDEAGYCKRLDQEKSKSEQMEAIIRSAGQSLNAAQPERRRVMRENSSSFIHAEDEFMVDEAIERTEQEMMHVIGKALGILSSIDVLYPLPKDGYNKTPPRRF